MRRQTISGSLAAAFLLILLLVSSCKNTALGPYDFDISRASQTGLAPTFQGRWEQHSMERIDWGVQLAASLAVETLHVGVEWGQIEHKSGDFNWSLTDLMVGVGGVRTSVVVNMLDASLPADIAEADFGTAEYVERFSQMLQALLERYQNSITHLWIGNEVNISLEEYDISPVEYGAFYQAAIGDLRSEYPNTKFGIVVTYAYEGEQIVADVIDEVKEGSIIGFTYYPQFLSHAPTGAKASFDLLDSYASDRGIDYAIVETAWSTAGAGGSEANQVDYLRTYLPLVASPDYPNRDFVCYWSLYDPRIPAWQKVLLDSSSVQYLESLGLIENDGTVKPGWGVFNEELSKLVN